MRAIGIHRFGGREVLEALEVPRPTAGPGEVLVRVLAAGVNPVDWKIRAGFLKDFMPHEFPVILGWDAAGVVEQAGPGAGRFREGDAVYAYCRKPLVRDGAYAEYIALPETSLAPKPARLSFEEAAAVPLAALTAYQSLFDAANLQAGESVLVHAAAGGVGGFAVQLARLRQAHVVATASAGNHDYVRSLGAAEVIDYRTSDFRAAVRAAHPGGVDVAYDTVGADVLAQSAEVLAPSGRLVSIVDPQGVERLKGTGVNAAFVFVAPHAGQLAELAAHADAGRLRVHLAAVLPLAAAARAHALIESGRTRGKIVLKITP